MEQAFPSLEVRRQALQRQAVPSTTAALGAAVMAAVVAPPSTPLQLLGEFAVEMLQAWVTLHAPSDPCGVPKRGFKNTYLAVLRSLVARHVDAAFQAFGPMISWMMVARSNGIAGLLHSHCYSVLS